MNEHDLMIEVRRAWQERVRNLRLRGPGKLTQAYAYMQGVLVTATACGVMTHDRAATIALQLMSGTAAVLAALEPAKRCLDCGAAKGEPCKGAPPQECNVQ